MKAVLCKTHGGPETLVIEEVDSLTPAPKQVIIEVHAAAVNFPDLLIIQNLYQFKPELPFSPGGEVSGVVARVGAQVTQFAPGDRVLASCGWGGYAQEVAVEEDKAYKIPDSMDFTSAAAFLMTYGTSYHALHDRGLVKAGENLLVLGAAGGVGLAAVELGAAAGARVIAAASSQEKCDLCKKHGAAETIVYPAGGMDKDQQRAFAEQIKSLTGNQGADVVYDPVGGDYSEPALRATNWLGRFLVVGFAAGTIPKIPLNLALLKGCQIVGVFWGAFVSRERQKNADNITQLMKLYEEKKIAPHISHTFPLEKAAEALNTMAQRKVLGKAVLLVKS